MLTIKLARRGKKNQPFFRLIILEKAKDPFGNYLENLGYWNPHLKKGEFKKDRILYWISKGAQLTDSVNNLLINQGVIKGEKRKVTRKKEKKTEEKPAATKAQKKTEIQEPARPEAQKGAENQKSAATEKSKEDKKNEEKKSSKETPFQSKEEKKQ